MSYSSSIKSTACLGRPALLGSDLSVVLNVDMVVGREGVDLVFRELGSEALDQLELGGNLAALLGDLLLRGVELGGIGTFLEGNVDRRHVDSRSMSEA